MGTACILTASQVLTPFGGLEQTWSALRRGACAVRSVERGGRVFPAAVIAGLPETGRAFALAVGAARQALAEDAASHPPVPPGRTGLVLATTKGGLSDWTAWRRGAVGRPASDHVLLSRMADDLALELGCRGAVLAVSNACVSGAQAVIEAVEMIQAGAVDRVLTVGIDILDDFVLRGFASLNALTQTTPRPFDAERDGLALGEAAAAVVLRRGGEGAEADATAIVGCGGSNDANHISGPSRDGSGLALAIERALQDAGRAPHEISALCPHGTATRYNDAMEARAFRRVFGDAPPPAFGVKGALGHTLGAAGLLEVQFCALALRDGLLPPTVGFRRGEADAPLDVVHGEERPWRGVAALSTNSGFGGMNTAVLLARGRPS